MSLTATERRAAPRWRAHNRRLPTVVAALTALYGLLSLISALLPAERARLDDLSLIVSEPASATATAGAAAAGLVLLQVARGLRRRKRRAWRAAVAVDAALIALHLVKGLDIEESTLAVVLLVVLLAGRREFWAKGDPASRLVAVGVGLSLLTTGIVSGLLLLVFYRHHLLGHPSLGAQLRQVLFGLVGVSGPLRFHGPRAADVVSGTLLGFGLLTALVTMYLVLRAAEPQAVLSAGDEDRLRELLDRRAHRDSLGYFALRRDKSVVWSPSGKAAVSYRVVSGVLLASGDPLGDPEAWPGAIEAFLALAGEHAWTPAVVACSELGGLAWRRNGLDALELGDEAVVEVADFTLEGRAMRNVRQMVHRVQRAGYQSEVQWLRDIDPAEIAQLRSAAQAWRRAETERGFSMALGRFGDERDGDCVVVTAYQNGQLRALLNFVPWGDDGLSLDLMRRDRDGEPGVNEYLITVLLAAGPRLGVSRVSLNFAAFRSALERGERLGAGPVSRLVSRLLVFASRWWQIESLWRFNAKFRPIWEPRFICFPTSRDLPRIALAALEAEAFVVRPRPLKWLSRRSSF